MKRTNKFLLAGAAIMTLGGMTACNNNTTATPEVNEGNTYAGMYISGGKSIQLRAITGKQEDSKGRDAESKLATLDLLSNKGGKTWQEGTEDQDGKFWLMANGQSVYKVSPWKTTAGKQTLALVANKGNLDVAVGTAKEYVFGTADTAADDIAKLSTDNSFVMTSTVEEKTIADNKTKEEVKAGTDEANNVFKMDLERVVAQGLVAKAAELKEESADGLVTVSLDDLKFAAVNGATKTFLFRTHAGDRQIEEATQLYKNYTSAIDEYAQFEAAKDPATAKENLIRLGNLGEMGAQKGYAAIAVAEDATKAKEARGIYFLENSVKNSEMTEDNKKFGFYRLAYAKIYATVTPKEVYTKSEDGKSVKKMEKFTAGTTFYRGAEDGLFYDSVEAAKLAKNTKVLTYTNGKCFYRALWNCQLDVDGKTVKSADTRRNNIYLLNIKEFGTIGTPWDPSDPNDPNLPKPNTPEEKEDGGDDPSIEKTETYMRVEASILPWNLLDREVILK